MYKTINCTSTGYRHLINNFVVVSFSYVSLNVTQILSEYYYNILNAASFSQMGWNLTLLVPLFGSSSG